VITVFISIFNVLIHGDHRCMEGCNHYFEVTCIVLTVCGIIWFMKSDRSDKNQFL
jgi:hypothetical protein